MSSRREGRPRWRPVVGAGLFVGSFATLDWWEAWASALVPLALAASARRSAASWLAVGVVVAVAALAVYLTQTDTVS